MRGPAARVQDEPRDANKNARAGLDSGEGIEANRTPTVQKTNREARNPTSDRRQNHQRRPRRRRAAHATREVIVYLAYTDLNEPGDFVFRGAEADAVWAKFCEVAHEIELATAAPVRVPPKKSEVA